MVPGLKSKGRLTESEWEDYEDARRLGLLNRLLKTGTRPVTHGDLGRAIERDSEVRDLWLGDIDPVDIEDDSVEQQISGFTYIDREKMKFG